MTWLALLAAREGRRAGFMAVAGVATGLTLLGALAASGVVLALVALPVAWEVVRWAGVVFITYLALETWFGDESPASGETGDARHFTRGLIVNLLNPKAAAVFLIFIPAFVGAPNAASTFLYTTVYVALATAIHALIVMFAATFQAWFNNPRREGVIRRVFAVMLAGVAIWLAIGTAR